MEKRFTVTVTNDSFVIRHIASGTIAIVHHISKPEQMSLETFREAWEQDLNDNAVDTMEKYFPRLLEEDGR